jgi:hypothetical protein
VKVSSLLNIVLISVSFSVYITTLT